MTDTEHQEELEYLMNYSYFGHELSCKDKMPGLRTGHRKGL